MAGDLNAVEDREMQVEQHEFRVEFMDGLERLCAVSRHTCQIALRAHKILDESYDVFIVFGDQGSRLAVSFCVSFWVMHAVILGKGRREIVAPEQ